MSNPLMDRLKKHDDSINERAVMYHGTREKFKEFDDTKARRGTFGTGHYLSNDEGLGKEYSGGKKPMKVRVDLKSPYEVDMDKGFDHSMERKRIFRDKDSTGKLKSQGHDGVLVKQGKYREVVAFSGKSLKVIDEDAQSQKIINYRLLSNYSLGQRARYGDRLAELEIRRREENLKDEGDDQLPLYPRRDPQWRTYDRTDTPMFKKWFRDSKIVDSSGKPLKLFHGTVKNFHKFDGSKNNPESNLGAGFYFTNMTGDASRHYADKDGPDLRSKIWNRMDRLTAEMEDAGDVEDQIAFLEKLGKSYGLRIEDDDGRRRWVGKYGWESEFDDLQKVVGYIARAEHVEHAGAVLPVYLRMEKPFHYERKMEIQTPVDSETEEYGEPEGEGVEFIEKLLKNFEEYYMSDSDRETLIGDLWAKAMDNEGIRVHDVYMIGREKGIYPADDNGYDVSGQIIQKTIRDLGYDGFIDRTVSDKFKGMNLHPSTVHYVVFDPKQIKSVYNRGVWDNSREEITESSDDYTYNVDTGRRGVMARHRGTVVGALTMDSRDKETGRQSAFHVSVHEKHRRKGIATRMYREAEKQFGEMHPSSALHDDGYHFWAKYRPEAVKDDLRRHKKKLMGKQVDTHYGPGKIHSVGSRTAMATLATGQTAPAKKEHIRKLISEARTRPADRDSHYGWVDSQGKFHFRQADDQNHAEIARRLWNVHPDNHDRAIRQAYKMGLARVYLEKGKNSAGLVVTGKKHKITDVQRKTLSRLSKRTSQVDYMTEAVVKEYPMADKDKDGWYSDGDYEGRGGKLKHMHPDEYLKHVRPLNIDDSSRENIEDLKSHMKSGRKLDPLKIYHDGKEDGRHRAHAARELGIKRVPVIDFRKDDVNEMAPPPHVERDHLVRRLIKHKLPIKRRESSKISDSEYLHVDVGDEHDEHGEKIGDRLLKVRISDHRPTRHAIQKHGAAHVEIGRHGHSVESGLKQILRHAGINETVLDLREAQRVAPFFYRDDMRKLKTHPISDVHRHKELTNSHGLNFRHDNSVHGDFHVMRVGRSKDVRGKNAANDKGLANYLMQNDNDEKGNHGEPSHVHVYHVSGHPHPAGEYKQSTHVNRDDSEHIGVKHQKWGNAWYSVGHKSKANIRHVGSIPIHKFREKAKIHGLQNFDSGGSDDTHAVVRDTLNDHFHKGRMKIREEFNETGMEARVNDDSPPKYGRSSISARKYKRKKLPVERRPKMPKKALEAAQAPMINYRMLSNYSLGQRARWGDRMAAEELQRRYRAREQEPPDAIEKPATDSYDPHVHGIDTRLPTGVLKNQIGNEIGKKRTVGVEALKLTPDVYEKNVRLVKDYTNIRKEDAALPTDELAEKFISHMTDNLKWLYNQVDPSVRERSKLWYVGANRLANRWANEYKLPVASVAGALAALSPQKDWHQNVSLAYRVLECLRGPQEIYKRQKFDKKMYDVFLSRDAFHKPHYEVMRNLLMGKTLEDIDRLGDDEFAELRKEKERQFKNPKTYKPEDLPELNREARATLKAMWIQIYDEAYNSPSYRLLSPEGDFVEVAQKKSGGENSAAWSSLNATANAIMAIEANGDFDVISPTMGDRHKVRNFFNNIFNPNDPDDVTIDTHAVGAALLKAVSQNTTEVFHNLDTSPDKKKTPRDWRGGTSSSSATGISGTYALYADAYRRAARDLKILPRELQSITWEAIRELFPGETKRHGVSAAVNNVWQQYREGLIDLNSVRRTLLEIGGGKINPPEWFTGERRERKTGVKTQTTRKKADRPDKVIAERFGYSSDSTDISGSVARRKTTAATNLRTRIGLA